MESFDEETPPKLRVLIASESSPGDANGVSNSVRQTAKYLKNQGHEALIVSPKPAPHEISGFEVIGTRSLRFQGFNLGVPGPRKLPNIIEKFKPDILHVASPAWTLGKTALLGAELYGVPSVAIYQTDVVSYAKRFRNNIITAYAESSIARLHNYATLNLAPSQSAENELISIGVRKDSIRRWGRGVDSERFHPELKDDQDVMLAKNEYSEGGKKVVVGYIGRLALEKSVERLAALKGLDANLVIVGDGPMKQQLEEVLPNAFFLGELRGKKLAKAYASLDIFAHTGTLETFGQTLQEAMASGLPVIAPAIGGPLDIVQQEVTGLLYSPYDNQALRSAVERLIQNPKERQSMGRLGRRAVEDRTWDVLEEELIDYYRLAISLHKQPKLDVVS